MFLYTWPLSCIRMTWRLNKKNCTYSTKWRQIHYHQKVSILFCKVFFFQNYISYHFLYCFAVSLFGYLCSEVTRGYVLENDEERYIYRRQKMYTFMKIPRELEKFMSYGFFHCLDSFLFVFTFLPIRFLTAMVKLVFRLPLSVLRYV